MNPITDGEIEDLLEVQLDIARDLAVRSPRLAQDCQAARDVRICRELLARRKAMAGLTEYIEDQLDLSPKRDDDGEDDE